MSDVVWKGGPASEGLNAKTAKSAKAQKRREGKRVKGCRLSGYHVGEMGGPRRLKPELRTRGKELNASSAKAQKTREGKRVKGCRLSGYHVGEMGRLAG
jgi:hypothetical protein